ncbi:MAG: hypothetical protein O3A65_06735 [Proteobacteria bacterium]|nr:hypothetical protein [Pseudomonadota bacterium]
MKALAYVLSIVFFVTCALSYAGVTGTTGPSHHSGAKVKPQADKKHEESKETSEK